MYYNVVKDGKVYMTCKSFEEAKSFVKILGLGFEIQPYLKGGNQ